MTIDEIKNKKDEYTKQAEELSKNIRDGEQQLENMKANLQQLLGAISFANEVELNDGEAEDQKKKK